MISYPIFTNDNYNFDGINFVRNSGPNIFDDGLIGWIEFDENDKNTLNYVVHEITQNTKKWSTQEEYEKKFYETMNNILSYVV